MENGQVKEQSGAKKLFIGKSKLIDLAVDQIEPMSWIIIPKFRILKVFK